MKQVPLPTGEIERVCFLCGDAFDGDPEDDMCPACWDKHEGGKQ